MAAGLGMGLCPAIGQAAAAAIDVPIRLSGNIPWTGVWLNGVGPFRFRVSSAGNVFTMSEPLGRKLDLETEGDIATGAGPNQTRRLLFRARELVIGGELRLGPTRLVASPGEGAFFSGSIPIPSDRVTAFEFEQGLMRYSPQVQHDVSAFAKVPLMPFDHSLGWIAKVECRLGGKLLRMRIGTATPNALVVNPDAVKRLGLWEVDAPYFSRYRPFGTHRAVEVRTTRRGDLELGGMRFERPVLDLYDPGDSVADHREDDGFIGVEVLRRVDLIFDPKRNMSWMRPTPAISEPWRYDRAGFVIGLDGGQQRIVQVDAASPASAAGLRVGDVLPGFDGDAAARLRDAQFGKAGTRLTFEIERGGAKQKISMILQDRI